MSLTRDLVNEWFQYNEGNLFWKKGRRAGDLAGTLSSTGYVVIGLNYKAHQAHRLIWLMFNGSLPEGLHIDHINRVKTDNRIENLRLATASQNGANRSIRKQREGMLPGVTRSKSKPKPYTATLCGKHLGHYTTVMEAHVAYRTAHAEKYREHSRYWPLCASL